jgi:hypothetical protein
VGGATEHSGGGGGGGGGSRGPPSSSSDKTAAMFARAVISLTSCSANTGGVGGAGTGGLWEGLAHVAAVLSPTARAPVPARPAVPAHARGLLSAGDAASPCGVSAARRGRPSRCPKNTRRLHGAQSKWTRRGGPAGARCTPPTRRPPSLHSEAPTHEAAAGHGLLGCAAATLHLLHRRPASSKTQQQLGHRDWIVSDSPPLEPPTDVSSQQQREKRGQGKSWSR